MSAPKLNFCKVLRHFYLEFEYEIAGSRLLWPSVRLHEGGGGLLKVNKMINTIILLVINIHSTKYIVFKDT